MRLFQLCLIRHFGRHECLAVDAFAGGGYADLYNIHRWTLGFVQDSPQGARYAELTGRDISAVEVQTAFERAATTGP